MNKDHRRKKIAIVATVPKMINFFILPYILELSKIYKVHVYTNKKINIETLNQLNNDIVIIHVPFERNIKLFKELFCLLSLLFHFFFKQYDLVYSISPKGGFLSTLACFITKTKNAHVFTGQVWITQKGILKNILILIDKFIAKYSNLIFIDSFSQKKFLENNKILPINSSSKIIGMGSISGVDLKKFKVDNAERQRIRIEKNINKNNFIFLFVGRLNKDKGIDLLIKAFAKIQKNNPETFLWLVGDDEDNYEERLHNIVRTPKNIFFYKYVENPMGFMNAGDVLCLPSFREGFGNVIIEGGACGLTCIGSNIYGINDAIVDKTTGILFSKGDINDLVNKMQFIINNSKTRKELSINVNLHVRLNFNQDYYVKSFIKLIREEID